MLNYGRLAVLVLFFALKVHFCRLTALTEHQLTSEFLFSVATYVTSDLEDYYKRHLIVRKMRWRHPGNRVALIRVIAIWELILADVSRVTSPIKKLLPRGDCFNWICELSSWGGAHFLRDKTATTVGERKNSVNDKIPFPQTHWSLTKTCSHDFMLHMSCSFSWAVAKEPAKLSLHNFMLSRHM